MTQRVFTPDDQAAFARLSGDYNPLHLDPVLARRLLFGRQVVHGLHALLWSLDEQLQVEAQPLELRLVKANFQAGIGVGQTVCCRATREEQYRITVKLEAAAAPAAWAEISWEPARHRRSHRLSKSPPDLPGKCRERSLEDVASAAGSIALAFDEDLAGRLFPNLTRVLPAMQLAALLATTRLVGMECPGYHSIYSSLNLAFYPDSAGTGNLNYRVADCNRRLALVSMDVEAPGTQGEIKAFLRPKPRTQASFAEICRQVEAGEFSNQRALIVGGSRGLGEVAAKLLAAGGADVMLTYHRGQKDARRVVAEIVSHGGKADCLPLNVLAPSQDLADRICQCAAPLYLYYFATPYIFGAAKGRFSPQRFADFCDFYVTGFLRTVQLLGSSTGGLQKVFFPSSTAVDDLPLDMGEYAAAKMAGEILCAFLQKAHPGIAVHKPRLPRIATDQTASLLPVSSQAPVPILLRNLRRLRQM